MMENSLGQIQVWGIDIFSMVVVLLICAIVVAIAYNLYSQWIGDVNSGDCGIRRGGHGANDETETEGSSEKSVLLIAENRNGKEIGKVNLSHLITSGKRVTVGREKGSFLKLSEFYKKNHREEFQIAYVNGQFVVNTIHKNIRINGRSNSYLPVDTDIPITVDKTILISDCIRYTFVNKKKYERMHKKSKNVFRQKETMI